MWAWNEKISTLTSAKELYINRRLCVCLSVWLLAINFT